MPEKFNPEDIKLFSKERSKIMLKQIDSIDKMHQVIKTYPPVTPIEPTFPSIIISAPFHFPKYDKIIKDKYLST